MGAPLLLYIDFVIDGREVCDHFVLLNSEGMNE